jgi:hypothetical protein
VGIPNRGKIQNDVAREMGTSLERARLDVAFWERLLARQLAAEVDDIVRAVAFREPPDNTEWALKGQDGKPMKDEDAKPWKGTILEAYLDRVRLSQEVLRELRVLVSRWGVNVTHLDLDFYKLDKDALKGVKQGGLVKQLEMEQKKKQAEAANDAFYVDKIGKAEAEVEAQRVRALVAALTEQFEGDLSPEMLEEIIVTAIRASGEYPMRDMTYAGLFAENRSEKK